jgi:uncharacterized protein GlcG (DUF336 family)
MSEKTPAPSSAPPQVSISLPPRYGSPISLATAAVHFRRSTKVFEDMVAGEVFGGIGVSGMQSARDALVARAGADAFGGA